jgi:EmrB/QacA subfamily drug resistance transporter
MEQVHNPPLYNKSLLLTLIILTSFINPFLGSAVNIALPKISSEFSMNAVAMSWVSMSFLLSSAVFLVPLGKLADIIGRKRIFVAGNIIVTMASLLCAVAPSGEVLIAFRVLQGIGSAMMFGTGMAIITSAFPAHERGKAIGISVSAVYIGLSVAPLLGGFLTQTLGWRSLFYITIPVGIFVIIAAILSIKTEWAEAKHESFDVWGAIIYMISVTALMYGFSKLPERIPVALTIAGLVGLVLFIYVELRATYPVLNIQLFKTNKIFAYSNLAALINYAATFAITFVLSLYLQVVKGFTPFHAGMVLVTQPFLMAIMASFAGRWSDKFDSQILASLGMGIIVVGLFLLSFLSETTPVWYIITSLVVLGTGFGLFSSPNTNSIMSSVEKKYLGVASATVGTMRLSGQMMSMGVATMVLHIFIGDSKISYTNHNGFMNSVKVIFILFTVLCFLGVFASLARGKKINNLITEN